MLVISPKRELEAGKSFLLLGIEEVLDFKAIARPESEIRLERKEFERARSQGDLLSEADPRPHEPCPYEFKLRYRCEDGIRTGTCQDWETIGTFFNWRRRYGETKALVMMAQTFGVDYPAKGMALAMGVHRRWHDKWHINGIIRIDKNAPIELGSLNSDLFSTLQVSETRKLPASGYFAIRSAHFNCRECSD